MTTPPFTTETQRHREGFLRPPAASVPLCLCGSTPVYQLLLARHYCHRHLARRARDHGIALRPADVTRIERRIERARPAWQRPGVERYVIRINRGRRDRLSFVYDARLACLVSVWRLPRRYSSAHPAPGGGWREA